MTRLTRPSGAVWVVLFVILAGVASAIATAHADQATGSTEQPDIVGLAMSTATQTLTTTATRTADQTVTYTPAASLTTTSTSTSTETASPTPTLSDTPSLDSRRSPKPTPSSTPTRRSTPTQSPTPTLTATPGIHVIFLPALAKPIMVNGGFESGFTGWQIGAALSPPATLLPAISAAYASQGSSSALLGDTNYQTDCEGNEPIGAVYVSQAIQVPPGTSVTLSFDYRIFTQDDLVNGDSFDVYVNQIVDDAAHHVYTDGNTNPAITGCANPPTDIFHGWKTGTVDLTSFAGQTITLYFAEQNRQDGFDVTYVYLDNVAVGTSPIQLVSRR